MRWKKLLFAMPVLAAAGYGAAVSFTNPNATPLAAAPKLANDGKPAVTLPISQVVLFNSGVGYFGRSGEIDGDARVDLVFPETEINDLLKSMTLQDFNKGRVEAVSYDSREPVSRTLASFAVNLNNNPGLSRILTQTRGEKVEVTLQPSATPAGQPSAVTGTIISLETQKLPSGKDLIHEVEVLNLLSADGLRSVKLVEILRIKFTNPTLESELKRALDVLALSHDTAKKAVQLHFAGEGKRRVKVSYVIEAPIWKTSYRLVLDKDGSPLLQGWAMVENPSDEDWSNVKMALVSGRPISFKMDLYNPLYVPRPTVEPELFASLRPPTYQGGFDKNKVEMAAQQPGGGGGGFDGAAPGFMAAPAPMADAAMRGRAMPKAAAPNAEMEARKDRKDYADKFGKELGDRMNIAAAGSAATAGALGDFFQYLIEHPVNLARQKSAMLPIVNKEIEGKRISIYNPNVQAKHPLLGIKFKNTTEFHLSQGPITVFEGSTYAGDARILDVQPNDERLIAYAIDLGTEVIPQDGPGSTVITSVKANRGIVTTMRKFRLQKTYKITNRSATDRLIYIEHPNRTNQQFKLVETPKPIEETAELFRFAVTVAAGKSAEFQVTEERDQSETIAFSNTDDNMMRYYINLNEASPALKEKLKQAIALRAKWTTVQRDVQAVAADLNRITVDQDRIRKNLRDTPKEAPVFDVYLRKLSEQEKEIDVATAKQKQFASDEVVARKAYEDFLATIGD